MCETLAEGFIAAQFAKIEESHFAPASVHGRRGTSASRSVRSGVDRSVSRAVAKPSCFAWDSRHLGCETVILGVELKSGAKSHLG